MGGLAVVPFEVLSCWPRRGFQARKAPGAPTPAGVRGAGAEVCQAACFCVSRAWLRTASLAALVNSRRSSRLGHGREVRVRRQCFNASSVAILAISSPYSVGMLFGIPWTTTEPSLVISMVTWQRD